MVMNRQDPFGAELRRFAQTLDHSSFQPLSWGVGFADVKEKGETLRREIVQPQRHVPVEMDFKNVPTLQNDLAWIEAALPTHQLTQNAARMNASFKPQVAGTQSAYVNPFRDVGQQITAEKGVVSKLSPFPEHGGDSQGTDPIWSMRAAASATLRSIDAAGANLLALTKSLFVVEVDDPAPVLPKAQVQRLQHKEEAMALPRRRADQILLGHIADVILVVAAVSFVLFMSAYFYAPRTPQLSLQDAALQWLPVKLILSLNLGQFFFLIYILLSFYWLIMRLALGRTIGTLFFSARRR